MITGDQKRDEIFLRLKKAMEQILQVTREKDINKRPEVTWGTHMVNDLGVDSLEIMDLVAVVEKEFGIKLDVQQFASQGVIGDLVGYIFDELKKRK